MRQFRQRVADLETRLAQAVVLDAEKQAEVACEGQARGITPEMGAAFITS